MTLWPTYASKLIGAIADALQLDATALSFDTDTLLLTTLQERSQAASVLVGAGYDAVAVARAVGLPEQWREPRRQPTMLYEFKAVVQDTDKANTLLARIAPFNEPVPFGKSTVQFHDAG